MKATRPEVSLGSRAWASAYCGGTLPPKPQNILVETENKQQPTKGEEMSKKAKGTKANKPRKAKAAKKQLASNGATGVRYDKIMEHSICSVVRRLGLEEVKPDHARAILAKHGVTMPEASLRVQLGYGRTGKRGVAELTREQVKELKASAEPETKPEAVAA